MAQAAYPNALRPITIGGIDVRNRIVMPAHTTNFGIDHLPSERHVAYHEARARGGAGLIIFESIRVHPSTLGKPQGIAGFDPACIEPFRAVADAVHCHGCKIFGQIISLGRLIDGDAVRVVPWGPSPQRWSVRARPARVMDAADIAAIVDGHVKAAVNVLEAGLDGLEIHLGHGHLLQQFLSPSSNHRTDEYGGSQTNRMRLPLEVLRAVRKAVGSGVCVGIRVSGDEYVAGGLTITDMEQIVPTVLDAVPLDFVNISHSAYHDSASLSTQMADMTMTPAPYRDVTRAITRAIRRAGHTVPTIAVCKIRTVAEADAIIARGDADMVAMARAHIADSDLVVKTSSGRAHEIRPCIGCNQGCAGILEKGLPITCLVNPTAGREATWTPDPSNDPAAHPRRVLVVGAGPAGLEAAWVAAARGHEVEVWERADEPGGAWRRLAAMPLRHDARALTDHQLAACERHGVAIRTATEATMANITAHRPDVVVLATGASPRPMILADGTATLTLEEALDAPWTLGTTVALIDLTGEWAAICVAEHLARQGRSVSVVTPAAAVAWHVTRYSATALFDRLRRLGVALRPMRQPIAHADGVLRVVDVSTGETSSIAAHTVIGADYGTPLDGLAAELRKAGVAVRTVGDALAPRTALEAVFEGHEAARAI